MKKRLLSRWKHGARLERCRPSKPAMHFAPTCSMALLLAPHASERAARVTSDRNRRGHVHAREAGHEAFVLADSIGYHTYSIHADWDVPWACTSGSVRENRWVIRRAFIQSERGIMSLSPTQSCLGEYKRPMAWKCLGQE